MHTSEYYLQQAIYYKQVSLLGYSAAVVGGVIMCLAFLALYMRSGK